ncbi:uroporphyrinogen-III synthase [Cellulomonas endophytica]|uniref:uroporphyrinogen-III synthase n=1 Tax=Cellulomonas endophytica TaxID=2494735 RepID=UPI0010105E2E|nr:uroporphyrinogen-III synthase [Cellulomonas endophytica]
MTSDRDVRAGTSAQAGPSGQGGTSAQAGTSGLAGTSGQGGTSAAPLAGRTVLVPGTASGGPAARVALAAAGARALVVPLLVTADVDDLGPVRATLADVAAGRVAWLAVTSAAAVPPLVAADAGLGAALAASGTRVAAVGPGTARALAAAGVATDLVPPASLGNAAGLLAVWPERPAGPAPRTVLLPRGDRALPTLPTGLRARGWDVRELVVYRTVDAPDPPSDVAAAWRGGGVDAVLLASPSAVDALVRRLGPPPPGVLVACIGATTADAARERGVPVHAVAAAPTTAALVAALVRAVDEHARPAGRPTPDAVDGPADDLAAEGSADHLHTRPDTRPAEREP